MISNANLDEYWYTRRLQLASVDVKDSLTPCVWRAYLTLPKFEIWNSFYPKYKMDLDLALGY